MCLWLANYLQYTSYKISYLHIVSCISCAKLHTSCMFNSHSGQFNLNLSPLWKGNTQWRLTTNLMSTQTLKVIKKWELASNRIDWLTAMGADYYKIWAGTATLTDHQIRMLFNDTMEDAVLCASQWLPDQVWRLSNDQPLQT